MKENKITPLKIGIRAQDIQTGLQDVQASLLDAETKKVRLVGMAERLAIHIRGSDVITDCKKLEYIATQFGIDALTLPSVLNVLEELDWVTVEKSGTDIKKVEETIPYFSDIYSKAGEYFLNSNPSEIEVATIDVCDMLALTPIIKETLKDELGLSKKDFQLILDIGKTGKIVDEYDSKKTKTKIMYSPLYWTENPEKIENMYVLLKKYGADKVSETLKKIKDYQGRPVSDTIFGAGAQSIDDETAIISEAIKRGIILAPAVDSLSGKKNFAFIPFVGLPLEEKITLEKAMAVLACVRYGQHFALITQIQHPEAILVKLLKSPYQFGSHTEIKQQYAILVGRGMGTVFPDRQLKGRYYFRLHPTEENLKAVKLAIDLLKVGELMEDKGVSKDLKNLLFNAGSYEEALRTLPKIKTPAHISSSSREMFVDVLNETMDELRGA